VQASCVGAQLGRRPVQPTPTAANVDFAGAVEDAASVGDHEKRTGLIATSAQLAGPDSAASRGQGGPRRTAKADARRRGPLSVRPGGARRCSEGAPKVALRWRRSSEGGQTSYGRPKPPTNFGPLDVDCVFMKLCSRRACTAVRVPGIPRPTVSRRIPKVDKRRTEGGTHRPISAPSLEIYWI
jgi:hypothetical protein